MSPGSMPSKKDDQISIMKSGEYAFGENFKSQDNRIMSDKGFDSQF